MYINCFSNLNNSYYRLKLGSKYLKSFPLVLFQKFDSLWGSLDKAMLLNSYSTYLKPLGYNHKTTYNQSKALNT